MRISERQRFETAKSNIEAAKTDHARMLERLASQKKINRLSEDPIGATYALRYRNRLNTLGQYQKNIEFSKGYLDRAESAISTIYENLMRAKELAIAMANDTYAHNSREATAREIREIIDEVVALANTKYNGRFVFSGFRTQTPALSRDGEFLGDDGAIFVQIAEGNFRQVNLQARNLFEASAQERERGHFNLMDSLQLLYDGMNQDNKDVIYTCLEELEHQMDKASSYQATVGSMFNALDQTARRLELDAEAATVALSNMEDADLYKVTSDFKRSEVVLQSTLLASNKLLQPSLINFMQ